MKRYVVGSAPLFPLAVSLILGIVCAEQWHFGTTLWPLLAVSVVLTVLLGRWAWAQTVAIYAAFFLMGGVMLGLKTAQTESRFSGKWQQIEVVVCSEPAGKPRTVAFDVLCSADGRKLKCYIEKDQRSLSLKPGDGIRLTTRLEPNGSDRHGRFDYGRFLERNGFSGRCFVQSRDWQLCRVSMEKLSLTDRSRLFFLRLRHQLLVRYRLAGADDDRYAVLAAMTLGDKSALSRDLRDVYSVAGASHVLALSGLHLGILYFIFTSLTMGLGHRQTWLQVGLVSAIWAFVFLVGMPVSLVRSAFMLSAFSLFAIGHRPHASVNVLCLSAIVILLQNPYALFDVGFQLSFSAVLAILLLRPLTECWVSAEWAQRHWLRGRLWDILVVSVAAQVGTAPLVAYHFGRFSTYFLLTNVVVLPAAYLILIGALVLLLLPWAPVATAVVATVGLLNRLLGHIARLPYASIDGLQPTAVQTLLCYVAILALYGALLRLNNLRLRP